jgi:hypothetical protein
MKNRDLIKRLLDEPLDGEVYIGKGMGPVENVEISVTDKINIVLSPKPNSKLCQAPTSGNAADYR